MPGAQYGAGITREVACPKSMVGRVIGKGGETIKALQKNFGANIQIDQSTEPMKVTVSGQPQAVELALSAVQEIINGGSPYLGPGSGGFGACLACPVSLSSALGSFVTLLCVPVQYKAQRVQYKAQRVWCGLGLAAPPPCRLWQLLLPFVAKQLGSGPAWASHRQYGLPVCTYKLQP